MTSTLVSIVIPMYNNANEIARTLESIGTTHADEFEVICVDDGSTDDTSVVANSRLAAFPHHQLIRQKNAGSAVARNTGMAAASGKWIMFIDADDELAEGALDHLFTNVATYNGYDVVLFDCCMIKGPRTELLPSLDTERTVFTASDSDLLIRRCLSGFGFSKRLMLVPIGAPYAKLFSRAFLNEFVPEGFDPALRRAQDNEFNVRVYMRIRRVLYDHAVVYNYRIRSTSITQSYNPKICDWLKLFLEKQRENLHADNRENIMEDWAVLALVEISEAWKNGTNHSARSLKRICRDSIFADAAKILVGGYSNPAASSTFVTEMRVKANLVLHGPYWALALIYLRANFISEHQKPVSKGKSSTS